MNVIMGAGTDLLVVDVVEVNVILFRCKQQSFCTCGSIYTDAVTCSGNMVWANRGGCG